MKAQLQPMRELLRSTLGESLRALRDEDRLAVAWTVACGRAMAEHGTITAYDAGIVHIEVTDPTWMSQMISLRGTLERELTRIAKLPISAIHFELKKS